MQVHFDAQGPKRLKAFPFTNRKFSLLRVHGVSGQLPQNVGGSSRLCLFLAWRQPTQPIFSPLPQGGVVRGL